MQIAFYSPLKSPHHPVPSGDRLMARLLIAALERCGHNVTVVSELRSFLGEATPEAAATLLAAADVERERLSALWQKTGAPDAWFCYHPYYKAPDLLGPSLASEYGLAYVTAEASYSERRNVGLRADMQARVADAIRLAAVNICMTGRDMKGLAAAVPDARLARLLPFIDPSAQLARTPAPMQGALVTVAMMRSGDKMDSYVMLAQALAGLTDIPWQLSVIGDGPRAAEVKALFSGFGEDRIVWLGEKMLDDIADILSRSSVYVWPGCGEAYGLAYLEAQAAGLPVVAQAIAGVPEVVIDGETGHLTPAGDIDAYADAIRRLLTDEPKRARLARAARRFVAEDRSFDVAAAHLGAILEDHIGRSARHG